MSSSNVTSRSIGIAVEKDLLRPEDALKSEADIERIKNKVGWRPKRLLGDMLFEMHESYLSA